MAGYPNSLPADVFDGVVKDVSISWSPGAEDKLAGDSIRLKGNPVTIKAASEHLAYNCVTRLGKKSGRIMYDTVSSIIRSNMLNYFQGIVSRHNYQPWDWPHKIGWLASHHESGP